MTPTFREAERRRETPTFQTKEKLVRNLALPKACRE